MGRPVDPRGVRRRSDRTQRRHRTDLHVDGQLPQRRLLEHLALQGVAVAVTIPAPRQDLGVGDLDPLLGVGLDREHPGLEDVAARPFQQPRVATLAEDRFVDLPGTLLLDDVGLDQFVADPHPEPGDRGVLGQGEIEHALQPALGVVDERLLDHGPGDLVANIDGDLVIADRQRHVAALDLGDQRADRLVGGLSLETLQPERVLFLRAAVEPHEFFLVEAVDLPALDLDL